MAEQSKDNNLPTKKKGIFGKTLDLVFRTLGVLLFSAIISVFIEWCGMYFFYPEEGYHHAEEMMKNEIGYLGSSFEADSSNRQALEKAGTTVDKLVTFLFLDSGIVDVLNRAREASPDDGVIVRTTKVIMSDYYNYLMAAVYVLIVFIIRFSILILSIPVFILFGLVGICDGLMQRDLRRWCGGNESGFIYHWAKHFSFPVLVVAWILYLSIPSSIHPNMIITPFAVMFGMVLMVMSSKFKKYL